MILLGLSTGFICSFAISTDDCLLFESTAVSTDGCVLVRSTTISGGGGNGAASSAATIIIGYCKGGYS